MRAFITLTALNAGLFWGLVFLSTLASLSTLPFALTLTSCLLVVPVIADVGMHCQVRARSLSLPTWFVCLYCFLVPLLVTVCAHFGARSHLSPGEGATFGTCIYLLVRLAWIAPLAAPVPSSEAVLQAGRRPKSTVSLLLLQAWCATAGAGLISLAHWVYSLDEMPGDLALTVLFAYSVVGVAMLSLPIVAVCVFKRRPNLSTVVRLAATFAAVSFMTVGAIVTVSDLEQPFASFTVSLCLAMTMVFLHLVTQGCNAED